MTAFIVRRLFWSVLVIFAAMTFTFVLTFLIPADPASQVAGPQASDLEVENVRRSLGLDKPVYVQYFNYVGRALQGDLGRSWIYRRPVIEAVFGRLPASILLGVTAALIELVLGGSVGILSAVYRHRWPDRISMVVTLILLSLPGFWLAILLLYVFGYVYPILPLGGYGTWQHLVLPAVAVGVPYAGWYVRMLRSSMREVMSQDYVRAARAKGLRERRVLLRHVVPNALIPIVTMWGIDLGSFVGGLALVEVVFGWPGVGWQAVEAAKNLDVPLVMGSVLLVASLMTLANLGVDISYHWLDPRVRYE
jgi:peptide/nickel transport system permease protein